MYPLRQLAKVEKHILLTLRDKRRYREWEERGRPPSPSFFTRSPLLSTKPRLDKTNPLMVLMVETQLHRCILCGNSLAIDDSLPSDHANRPSFDHVVSKAKGGQNQGNRIAAHRQCNSIKSNRDPTGCELIWLEVVNKAIHNYNTHLRTKWIR